MSDKTCDQENARAEKEECIQNLTRVRRNSSKTRGEGAKGAWGRRKILSPAVTGEAMWIFSCCHGMLPSLYIPPCQTHIPKRKGCQFAPSDRHASVPCNFDSIVAAIEII